MEIVENGIEKPQINPNLSRALIHNLGLDEDTLLNGEIRSKKDVAFECIGLVDELNANVGMAIQLMLPYHETDLTEALETIQCRLVDVGNHIATPRNEYTDASLIEQTNLNDQILHNLARVVDLMDFQLPRLAQFILPGGSLVSAQFHICRTVSRRVERNLVPLLKAKEVDDITFKFMNRLSDFFYVAARYMCMLSDGEERLYKKGQDLEKRKLNPKKERGLEYHMERRGPVK